MHIEYVSHTSSFIHACVHTCIHARGCNGESGCSCAVSFQNVMLVFAA